MLASCGAVKAVYETWRRGCLDILLHRLDVRCANSPVRRHVRSASNTASVPPLRMEDYGVDLIRNFSIIAHIDHGKSTLADRLLERTGTVEKISGSSSQMLDKLKVERERGITVKAQTVSMLHEHNNKTFLLNLIDTPGHVDFAWEVSRSLAACQGALLLIDATQGVQAQTISVGMLALEKNLTIIPVLNKIDLPAADPDRMAAQIESTFGIGRDEILTASAKTGAGVDEILRAIVDRIPPPSGDPEAELKALLFDSSYDRYRGVISLLSVQSGRIRKGDKILLHHTQKKYDAVDVGVLHPEETPTEMLQAGQVGYLACNMKNSSEAQIGDTIFRVGESNRGPLDGFQPTKAMVFAGIFPIDSNDFPKLEESIKRLTLTDRSVTIQRESSTALGQGCRLGFLGTLHMDVFRQRLEDEYDQQILITNPTVPFKIVYKNGKETIISNPNDFPDPQDFGIGKVQEVHEPMVKATIILPNTYLGGMINLCSNHRAEALDHVYLDTTGDEPRVLMTARLPLAEIVTDFFDKLKKTTSGFASFDYEDVGYQPSDMVKISFLLNGRPIDSLAIIVHRSNSVRVGRIWAKKLREVVPKQLFEVAIQAAVGRTILARETISAMRKDVTAGLYGGHYERKMKVLEKQKAGKKLMKRIGNIDLPQEAFYDILRSNRS
ncbi:GTP-binding protein lepa [Calocera cornea HHB12733]|uniref:GTP-binding protein lepa n=1 Tax=Calocera cornea HHB12733 TaxID=1353952 RepID=A0A165H8M4_9BASI|nr:GTP-binding protein lepa [Calocera cornea HHB12733]